MCSVSMITNNFDKQYPPINQWPYQQAVDLSEVLKKLDDIDKKMGAKDCNETGKEAFFKALEDRIAALEAKVKP